MNQLYPIRFRPILKDMIWGGSKLRKSLGKPGATDKSGESWEISDVKNNSSVVENGFLAGNTLGEIIEIYMADLLGDKVYERFGQQFPLLIKYIDANDKLSIQVHPDDKMAYEKHKSYGKSEMWYVVQAEPSAKLIVGFNKTIDADTYLQHLNGNTLPEILNFEDVKAGDVFYLPAGRIHAIGEGLLIAEIQQTSDVTYRIFDWNRTDAQGKPRELHTELALQAIDFSPVKDFKTPYKNKLNHTVELVKCDYFTTNLIELDQTVEKDYESIDSFVIYMCTEGEAIVKPYDQESITIKTGDTILIPAVLKNIIIEPVAKTKILEVYID